jgi:hypothetical protein
MQRLFVPVVLLALLLGGAGGYYFGRGGDSAATVAGLQKDNEKYKDQITTLQTQLTTAQNDMNALAAQKQQLQDKLTATQVQVQLLEDGLAVYTSAHDLVVAYATAIQKRNGAVARSYLGPAIKESIQPVVLGTSNPYVARYVIQKETPGSGEVALTAVVRFYDAYSGQGEIAYHDDTLTIGKGSDGRFLITNILAGAPVPTFQGK